MHSEELIVYNSPWKNILLLVMTLVLVAGGVLMLRVDGPTVVALGSLLFFGLCAGVFVWRVLDRKPRIVLNDVGIFDRTLRVGIIQWKDIENAYVWSYRGADCICLELNDPERYLGPLSTAKRALVAANKALGATPIVLNVSATDVGTARIREHILDRIAAIRYATS